MSNKHLTVSAWEAVARKSKLDPKPLSKVLVAYGRCDEENFEELEEALGKIKKEAAALEKDKDYKEVAGYLEEVGDAAADELKDVLKRAKEEEAEEEDDEEGAGEGLGPRLLTALKTVKSLGEPVPGDESFKAMKFIACIAPGGCGLLIGRKVGSAAKKLTASISGSGGKYHRGDCVFEKNKYTFVVEKMASGMAKKFGKALFDATGQKFAVRVRGLDGSEELDDETDLEAGAEAGPGPTVTPPNAPPPPATKEASDNLKVRLGKVLPLLKEALAKPGELGPAAKAVAAEVSALAKAGDYAGALEAMARLEAMLGVTSNASSTESTTTATTEDDGRARWFQLYDDLILDYEEAVDREDGSNPEADELIRKIQAAWQWAEDQADAKAYDKGILALQKIAPLFEQVIAAKLKTQPKDEGELVRQRQFLLKRWHQIPGELHAEVAKMEQQIAAAMPEEDAAELGVLTNDYLDDFLFSLNDEVNNAINEGNVAGLSALKQKVAGDPLFHHLQSTPFVDGSVFQGIVIAAIDEIEKNLSK